MCVPPAGGADARARGSPARALRRGEGDEPCVLDHARGHLAMRIGQRAEPHHIVRHGRLLVAPQIADAGLVGGPQLALGSYIQPRRVDDDLGRVVGLVDRTRGRAA